LKIPIALLFLILFSNFVSANENVACLIKHYDEYSDNRIALFKNMHRVYAQKHPETYKVYAPVLSRHALFARIDQFVFRHFAERDIRKLKLRHGFTNATPNWIKDACRGHDCTNALYLKLAALPEFDTLYTEWDSARKEAKASYKQKAIAQAGRLYFELLGEKSVLPHALKDMQYYDIKVPGLVCD